MKVNWSEPLTKGRQVYAGVLGSGRVLDVNYISGFLIGWDRWNDETIDWYPSKQGWMSSAE